MARSLKELPALLDEVDLVVEARDARLPLTSVNHSFDALLERVWGHAGAGPDRKGKGKEKIVVYTKRDLAEARYEQPLQKAFWNQARQRVLFADTRQDADVRSILRVAARAARENGETATDMKVLVVGMPNVGKSSLLNALRRVGVRKGKAFITGAMPGVTRRLTGTVRVYDQPPIYVFDTPGVMIPFLGHGEVGSERGLKLALTAGIKDGLFEPETIAAYLLFKLNLRMAAESHLALDNPARHESYTAGLPLPRDFVHTEDTDQFLHVLATRLGALRRGAEPDIDAAITFLLRTFREGKLGRWTLDDLDGAEAEYVAASSDSPSGQSTDISPTIVSDLGAVGTRAPPVVELDEFSAPVPVEPPVQEDFCESGLPLSPVTDAANAASLDQRVSSTVRAFLAKATEERADADAGRNRSVSQEKKADLKAKAEAREAKRIARGVGKKPPPGVIRPRRKR